MVENKKEIEYKNLKELILKEDKEKNRQYILRINQAMDTDNNNPVFVRIDRETVGKTKRIFIKKILNCSLGDEINIILKGIEEIKSFKLPKNKEKTSEKTEDINGLTKMIKSLMESNKQLQRQINDIKKK